MRLAYLSAIIALIAANAASANIGRVKLVSGPAVIERGAQKIAAIPGMALLKGDTIVTGKAARLGVTFNDNTRFAVGPGARVNITDYAFDDATYRGKFLTKVDRGSLGIVSGRIAKSNRDAMRVKTPTALLGVRGTRFVVDVK